MTGIDTPSWDDCPAWPPDVFAIATYLIEHSGCYALTGLVGSRSADESETKTKSAAEAKTIGAEWKSNYRWDDPKGVPDLVKQLWKTIIACGAQPLTSIGTRIQEWHRPVLKLMACADEASLGAGFFPSNDAKEGDFGLELLLSLNKDRFSQDQSIDRDSINSITKLVDRSLACVMPKSLTPAVGCTLRSLSHHLALLPGIGSVATRWLPSGKIDNCFADEAIQTASMNIMLIPFPYVVLPTDFVPLIHPSPDSDGYFTLQQGWLRPPAEKTISEALFDLVNNLLLEGLKHVSTIHQIIFPEAALKRWLVEDLANKLARQYPSIESVISGTMDTSEHIYGLSEHYQFADNCATLVEISDGFLETFTQKKHHRWRLNEGQIKQYKLEPVLPTGNWWERLDVYPRELTFVLDRRNWVRTILVCEDLARVDPVSPVVNAIGPNWVIALLMDGPQMTTRWPRRYATVLADDPGSSVLTVTSIGMVERSTPSNPSSVSRNRSVGLWSDAISAPKELELAAGNHAVIVTLKPHSYDQMTMDRRRDGGTSVILTLEKSLQVSLAKPPAWINRSE